MLILNIITFPRAIEYENKSVSVLELVIAFEVVVIAVIVVVVVSSLSSSSSLFYQNQNEFTQNTSSAKGVYWGPYVCVLTNANLSVLSVHLDYTSSGSSHDYLLFFRVYGDLNNTSFSLIVNVSVINIAQYPKRITTTCTFHFVWPKLCWLKVSLWLTKMEACNSLSQKLGYGVD